jgi:surface protein
MQDFVDSRGLSQLYYFGDDNGTTITDADIMWLADVDTSKCTTAANMFRACKKITQIPLFDTSNVTNMQYMFAYTSKLSIPLFDTSNVTDMRYMFYQSNIKDIPLLDTSKVTIMYQMLTQCFYLTSVPHFDTSNVTNMDSMFYSCRGIEALPLFNTSKVTNMQHMCYGMEKLKTFPQLDMSKVTSGQQMFEQCYALETVPKLNTSALTSAGYLFRNCRALHTVTELDFRNVTSVWSMLEGCPLIENIKIKNIKYNLQVASGTTYGHLLTVDSLVGLCYELRDTGALKTLTIGSANLAKLASVYVRSIEITDEMRAEDDLIDEKLPFERCESTDEGATLIGDYVILKNWKLA